MYPWERAPRLLAILLRISLRIHLPFLRLAKASEIGRALLDLFLPATTRPGIECEKPCSRTLSGARTVRRRMRKPLILNGARSGTRTRTTEGRSILSALRIPISPSGLEGGLVQGADLSPNKISNQSLRETSNTSAAGSRLATESLFCPVLDYRLHQRPGF